MMLHAFCCCIRNWFYSNRRLPSLVESPPLGIFYNRISYNKCLFFGLCLLYFAALSLSLAIMFNGSVNMIYLSTVSINWADLLLFSSDWVILTSLFEWILLFSLFMVYIRFLTKELLPCSCSLVLHVEK